MHIYMLVYMRVRAYINNIYCLFMYMCIYKFDILRHCTYIRYKTDFKN